MIDLITHYLLEQDSLSTYEAAFRKAFPLGEEKNCVPLKMKAYKAAQAAKDRGDESEATTKKIDIMRKVWADCEKKQRQGKKQRMVVWIKSTGISICNKTNDKKQKEQCLKHAKGHLSKLGGQ